MKFGTLVTVNARWLKLPHSEMNKVQSEEMSQSSKEPEACVPWKSNLSGDFVVLTVVAEHYLARDAGVRPL